jgi:hypothetical protein
MANAEGADPALVTEAGLYRASSEELVEIVGRSSVVAEEWVGIYRDLEGEIAFDIFSDDGDGTNLRIDRKVAVPPGYSFSESR